MKLIPQELQTFQAYENQYLKDFPKLRLEQENQIQKVIEEIRQVRKNRPFTHLILEIVPLILLLTLFALNLLWVPSLLENKLLSSLLVGTLHGILGYSFIVYTLHEGAGHGIMRKYPLANRLIFNLPRLRFADPEYYREFHTSHHNYLGTEKDGSFSHFISLSRFIKSISPGAGILYKNDYQVHQNPVFTKSRILAETIGLLTLVGETYLLQKTLGIGFALLALLGLSPWIGMILDRCRETLEHRYMPANRKYGSRELGLGPLGLLIGGGPWGQPCHFSHHLAPDLQWYGQILLHFKVKQILTQEQRDFFFFSLSQLKPLFKKEVMP